MTSKYEITAAKFYNILLIYTSFALFFYVMQHNCKIYVNTLPPDNDTVTHLIFEHEVVS